MTARKVLNATNVARNFIDGMRPHIAHQTDWEVRDVDIWCRYCEREVLKLQDFQIITLFDADSQLRIRETVSRWIRSVSPDDQKLIFKL